MTDDELDRLEQLADARTVDADVRAGLERLVRRYRSLQREADDLCKAARKYKRDAEDAQAREFDAGRERDDALMESGRHKERADDMRDAIRDYVRERQDEAVLGPDRCRTERYFAKLEQLV